MNSRERRQAAERQTQARLSPSRVRGTPAGVDLPLPDAVSRRRPAAKQSIVLRSPTRVGFAHYFAHGEVGTQLYWLESQPNGAARRAAIPNRSRRLVTRFILRVFIPAQAVMPRGQEMWRASEPVEESVDSTRCSPRRIGYDGLAGTFPIARFGRRRERHRVNTDPAGDSWRRRDSKRRSDARLGRRSAAERQGVRAEGASALPKQG